MRRTYGRGLRQRESVPGLARASAAAGGRRQAAGGQGGWKRRVDGDGRGRRNGERAAEGRRNGEIEAGGWRKGRWRGDGSGSGVGRTFAVAILGVVVLCPVELAHAHEDELVVLGVVRLGPSDRVAGQRELPRPRPGARASAERTPGPDGAQQRGRRSAGRWEASAHRSAHREGLGRGPTGR